IAAPNMIDAAEIKFAQHIGPREKDQERSTVREHGKISAYGSGKVVVGVDRYHDGIAAGIIITTVDREPALADTERDAAFVGDDRLHIIGIRDKIVGKNSHV